MADPEFDRENRRAEERRAGFRHLRGGAVPGRAVDAEEALEMVEENRQGHAARRKFRVLGGTLPAVPLEASPASAVPKSSPPALSSQRIESGARVHFGIGVRCAIRCDSAGSAMYEVYDIRAGQVVRRWPLDRSGLRQPQTDKFAVGSWDVLADMRPGAIALRFFQQPHEDAWFKGLRRLFTRLRGGESIQLHYEVNAAGIRAGFDTSKGWKKAG